MKLTRREFGKQVLYSAAALSASLSFPTFLIPSAAKSRVVIARSEKLKRVNHQLSEENAAYFLDQALVKFTGILPRLLPGDRCFHLEKVSG